MDGSSSKHGICEMHTKFSGKPQQKRPFQRIINGSQINRAKLCGFDTGLSEQGPHAVFNDFYGNEP
jgi:hypothetical protein